MAERVERVERELAGVAAFLAERLPLPELASVVVAAAPGVATTGVAAAMEPSSMVSSPLTEVVTDEVEPMRKPCGGVVLKSMGQLYKLVDAARLQ